MPIERVFRLSAQCGCDLGRCSSPWPGCRVPFLPGHSSSVTVRSAPKVTDPFGTTSLGGGRDRSCQCLSLQILPQGSPSRHLAFPRSLVIHVNSPPKSSLSWASILTHFISVAAGRDSYCSYHLGNEGAGWLPAPPQVVQLVREVLNSAHSQILGSVLCGSEAGETHFHQCKRTMTSARCRLGDGEQVLQSRMK